MIRISKRAATLGLATLLCLVVPGLPVVAQDKIYGCFEVVGADAINIREKAWSKSPVIGTAKRGELLAQWKVICSLRGFWCPVQKGDIRGHRQQRLSCQSALPLSLAEYNLNLTGEYNEVRVLAGFMAHAIVRDHHRGSERQSV